MTESNQHKKLKEKEAEIHELKGYDVTLEYRTNEGIVIDVLAEKDEKSKAIEIGCLNGRKRLEKMERMFDEVKHVKLHNKRETRPSKDYQGTNVQLGLDKRLNKLVEVNKALHNFDNKRESIKNLIKKAEKNSDQLKAILDN